MKRRCCSCTKKEIMRLKKGSTNEGLRSVLLGLVLSLWQFQDYGLEIQSWLSLLYWFLGRDKLLLCDSGLKIHVMVFIPSTCSRIASRVSSRIWRGVMWHVCYLRADSVVWLSHTYSIWPWSGVPKVWLYNTFLGGLRHLWTTYIPTAFLADTEETEQQYDTKNRVRTAADCP